MAEINTSAGENRHKKSLRQQKKLSTKVDLTPMVDLGFLLITFFIVTTTWSKPKVAKLYLPEEGSSTEVGDKAVLTILAGKDNKIFYYQGNLLDALHDGLFGITDYSFKNGIGEIIRQKQLAMDKNYKGGRKELTILIKPSADASYQNVIELLDETIINVVLKYALVDIAEDDKKLLKEKMLID
jgi:biopolymer transport protein ExbD